MLRRPKAILAIAMAAATSLAWAGSALATTLPAGFSEATLASGLTQPTMIDWAPDGRMFIAEEAGRVKVRSTDGSVTTLLDISGHVNDYQQRGLLGIAVDSDFANNHYLYLLYTYEGDAAHANVAKVSRLTRVVVNANNTVANPTSPETVLLGSVTTAPCPAPANTVDCIPSDGSFHSVGTVRSAPDGTLWVGSGDANSDRLRTYNEQSFAGKIMHVDRSGNGLSGHPFCPADNDLTHVCTKLYAKGFRNPYRFALRPGASPAVADVGESDREEIDFLKAGGNYGWPCFEGTIHTPSFASDPNCTPIYASSTEAPVYDYGHTADGGSVIGGPVYTASAYPAAYHGDLFFGDWVQGFIRRLKIGAGDQVTGVEDFATNWTGVAIELSPSGNLTYVDYSTGAAGTGSVREIRYGVPVSTAYRDAVLGTPGLVSYWRLGEASGTTAADAKGSNPGSYVGGPALGQGGALPDDPNTAVGFDGADDEMTASGSGLALGGSGSIEGWFYWNGGTALARDSTTASSAGWILAYDSGGKLAYRVGGKSFVTTRSTASVRGGWHHFALTASAGTTALYVDGAKVHDGTGAPQTAQALPWHVMRNGTYAEYASGRADELAIYNRALTGAEVKSHYDQAAAPGTDTPPAAPLGLTASAGDGKVQLDWSDNGESDLAGYDVFRSTTAGGPYTKVNAARVTSSSFSDTGLANGTAYYYVVRAVDAGGNSSGNSSEVSATPSASAQSYRSLVLATPGLVSYWRLGEQSGTVAADERGQYPGSYLGGPAFGQAGALGGDSNSSVGFDGVNDELDATGAGLALTGTGSVEGWFYWLGGTVLARDTTAASNAGWILGYDSGGQLAYRVGGKSFVTTRTTASVRNGWHHVVLTVFQGATTLYLDGVKVHGGTGAPASAVKLPWRVMRNGTYADYSSGRADELAIYNSALSPQTVAQHYQAGHG